MYQKTYQNKFFVNISLGYSFALDGYTEFPLEAFPLTYSNTGHIIGIDACTHRLHMELDLQSLFGLHVT
jgi:hypothetical protein